MLNIDFETVSTVTGIFLGVYEIVSRVMPTTKTWSIIGNVLNVVSFLSKKLDRKQKAN